MRFSLLTILAMTLFLCASCRSLDRLNAPEPETPGVYTVYRIAPEDAPKVLSGCDGDTWDEEAWTTAEVTFLSNFHPESTYFGTRLYLRLLHDGKRIYCLFLAKEDRFVQAAAVHPQSLVCLDTCAEFFMAPGKDKGGYLNVEASLDGFILANYHKSQSEPWLNFGPVSEPDCQKFRCEASKNCIVLPEIKEKSSWWILLTIDAETVCKYTDTPFTGDLSGMEWKVNFYHCSDRSSHPRWLSWMPISELNFHLPKDFGTIHFQ